MTSIEAQSIKEDVVDYTPEKEGARLGERIVFWSWAGVILLGLAYMFFVPLVGR